MFSPSDEEGVVNRRRPDYPEKSRQKVGRLSRIWDVPLIEWAGQRRRPRHTYTSSPFFSGSYRGPTRNKFYGPVGSSKTCVDERLRTEEGTESCATDPVNTTIIHDMGNKEIVNEDVYNTCQEDLELSLSSHREFGFTRYICVLNRNTVHPTKLWIVNSTHVVVH